MSDFALAVDIGGTKVAAALVAADGTVAERRVVPTAGSPDPEEVWRPVAGLVADLRAAAGAGRVAGVGVGSAGPIHLPEGSISPVNIPAWRRFPLLERLAELVPGVPVRLAGDGSCAAVGEHWRGAGQGVDDLLAIVVSTGVGGGLIQAGRLVAGPTGNAGHIGHMVVDHDGVPCPCGGRGCVEAMSSGPSMVTWALKSGWQAPVPAPTGVDLADAARAGDPHANEAFQRSGRSLAAGIVSTAAICDLSRVVIGGGVAAAHDLLFPPLRAAIAEHGRLAFLRQLTVATASLGNAAGLVGAAALVLAPEAYAGRGVASLT
ncbi:ROK family protein [Planotetraspora kaengkrachanensis]|uniref:Sugar kinase n=1 Tax=Planotetraspora kaengkrachanensis TaxID=575193 RepID=A0A8J3M5H9_9ACTN|nr:ROK family protein [Planotetraspora kaengkrachanensis]GIG77490.1 sugar kinase [Planotetraspora kaengkrachanensis]